MSAKTAVLLMTFARPQYARRVFDCIKEAKPEKFYFYSNKAREDRPAEIAENEEIRSWVKDVDWPCELHTFFRNEYVDVYTSTHGAMDWVFENEEAAVILEDDCVPSVAFFDYCDRFLAKYKDDKSVGFLSGANYIEGYSRHNADHLKSPMAIYWGFATWKDRWKGLDFDIDPNEIVAGGYIDRYYRCWKMRGLYKCLISDIAVFIKRTRVWDYIFVLNNYKKGMYGIYPTVNLVRNIGAEGTHTDGDKDPGTYVSVVYDGTDYPCVDSDGPLCDERWDRVMFDKILSHLGRRYMVEAYMRGILGDKVYGKILSLYKKFKNVL